MVVYPAYHSTEAKSFLGITIPAGTPAAESLRIALDRLAAHPNVGPFIGRQLIQRFTTSNPSPAYVSAVASAFNGSGSGVRGDMKAVLKAVLMHPESRVVSETSGKVREPVLRLSAFMRAFPHRSQSGEYDIEITSNPATGLGQAALHSPSVFNFYRPGYVAPATQSAARGLVAPEMQILSETSAAGYVNFMQKQLVNPNGSLVFNYDAEIALAADPAALVARLDRRLTNTAMSAATRDEIVATVTALPAGTAAQNLTRVRTAILMTLASPEFVVQK